jgi:hypothetical protein
MRIAFWEINSAISAIDKSSLTGDDLNEGLSRQSQTLRDEGAESGGSLLKKMAELPKEEASGMLGLFIQ